MAQQISSIDKAAQLQQTDRDSLEYLVVSPVRNVRAYLEFFAGEMDVSYESKTVR
jgi:hypothetical protein